MDEWVNTNLENVEQVRGNRLAYIPEDLEGEVEKGIQNYWLCNSQKWVTGTWSDLLAYFKNLKTLGALDILSSQS